MLPMVPCSAVRLRRIWSETLPYATLREARVIKLLRRYELGVHVAVRPWTLNELPSTWRALRDEGLEVGLWPMLGDAEGRWASARNAEAFAAFTRRVAEKMEEPGEVVVDLEPPIEQVRSAMTSVRGVGRLFAATG